MPPAKRTRDHDGTDQEEQEGEGDAEGGSDEIAAKEPLEEGDATAVDHGDNEDPPGDHPDGRDDPRKKHKTPSSSPSLTALAAMRSSSTIPNSRHYHVSFMHADVVTAAVASPKHGYVVTASRDGVVKFWKRLKVGGLQSAGESGSAAEGSLLTTTAASAAAGNAAASASHQHPCLEFVKSFTAHAGPVQALAVDDPVAGGDVCCSVGVDHLVKWYDVATFDVVTMVQSPFPLGSACCAVAASSSGAGIGAGRRRPGETGSGLLWAVSSADSGSIYIFSMDAVADQGPDEQDEEETSDYDPTTKESSHRNLVATVTLHGANRVTTLTSIPGRSAALSTDVKGIVEVWSTAGPPSSIGRPCTTSHNGIAYRSKFDTDLYELFKKKTYAVAAAATSNHYVLYGRDGKIRVFRHSTGKIVAKLDERLATYEKQREQPQSDGSDPAAATAAAAASEVTHVDALEFGRRAAIEREIGATSIMSPHVEQDETSDARPESYQHLHIEFDPTGDLLLIPTLLGIKVVDWKRRALCAVLGGADASQLRFIGALLCHGDAKVNKQMELARMSAASSSAPVSAGVNKQGVEERKPVNDTLVIAIAYQMQRLYVFSHVDPVNDPWQPTKAEEGPNGSQAAAAAALVKRDVYNEAPSASDPFHLDALQSRRAGGVGGKRLPTKAVLRTTMGDIHIQLFSAQVPKTIENFAGHASSGYYDDVIFHRVIKGFMLQTGDPLGDGTGGESIWGGEFEDEFVPGLRHDRPFTVSMANAGPNTNGSQFYITTVPTPWLDQKHTVFGRVVSGMDVCTSIENVKTDDLDKPLTEIRIVNVDLSD